MELKYFVLLVLLPCIFATEIENAICIDGTQCPAGQYCCELQSGKPGCCELSKERIDEGFVPALPPSLLTNITVSMAQSETMNSDYCFGTQCGVYCAEGVYGATCCDNPQYACPSATKCCSNSYLERPWCCRSNQRCSSIRFLCLDNEIKPPSCIGTLCGSNCFESIIGGTCCTNQKLACPFGKKCCSNSYFDEHWCCSSHQRCSSVQNLCINGAVTTSAAIMSMVFAFIIGAVSKYSL